MGEISNGFDPVYSLGQFAGGSSSDSGVYALLPAAYAGGFNTSARSSKSYDATSFFTQPTLVPGTLFTCLFPNPPVAQCPLGQQGFGPLPSPPGTRRNSFYGPGYFDLDATLSKQFGLPTLPVIGEGANIEFRANFYNLTNKLNLWNLQTDIAACPPAQRPCNGHLGEAQQVLGARVIEMQARFSF